MEEVLGKGEEVGRRRRQGRRWGEEEEVILPRTHWEENTSHVW